MSSTLNPLTWARGSYDWVLRQSETKYAFPVLMGLAFIEAVFFPIPPDIMVITMTLAVPRQAGRIALVCTVGSVLGGIAGFLLGAFAMESVGQPIVDMLHLQETFDSLGEVYREWGFWAVFVAGFTPIPYKIFTLAAGAFGLPFSGFVVASVVSRGLRYAIIAYMLKYFGESARSWIEKNFNALTLIFVLLLMILIALKKIL